MRSEPGRPGARSGGPATSATQPGASCELQADHAGERLDAALVERAAGVVAQQLERALGRPGGAVDAVGDERVVDVADREDPRVQRQLLLGQAARVAAAVEALVMVGDEVANGGGEAAELLEQAPAGLGVALDLRVLLVGQPGGLAQDLQRHGELADVVQQPADGQVAARRGRQLELLADLGGEDRHAAGVLLGGAVALGQADHQRAHARAEVGLLGGDEVGRREVADEREGGAGAGDVARGGDGDHRDGGELERVAEVVAERHRADHELRDQRDAEPDAADGDQQVGRAAGEPEGAGRAMGEHDAEAEAAGEQRVGGVGAGGRDLGDDRGASERDDRQRHHERGEADLERRAAA